MGKSLEDEDRGSWKSRQEGKKVIHRDSVTQAIAALIRDQMDLKGDAKSPQRTYKALHKRGSTFFLIKADSITVSLT